MARPISQGDHPPIPLHTRIDKMHNRDRIGITAFIALLWFTFAFVLYQIVPSIQNTAVLAIILVAGALVLLFNTAAIWAMLVHYSEDKTAIYSLDLKHLDAMRRRRGRSS